MVCGQLLRLLTWRILLPGTPTRNVLAEKCFRSIRSYGHFLL